jgi:hypothetical protein
LRKLRDTLRIPVLALVDSDPYGLKILSVYMKGAPSQTTQHSEHNTRLESTSGLFPWYIRLEMPVVVYVLLKSALELLGAPCR